MLNREPMGMKPAYYPIYGYSDVVSVLNREPMGMKLTLGDSPRYISFVFQCSTASRWG